jgi:hypothetical protein
MTKEVEMYKNNYIMYNELLLRAVASTLKITNDVQCYINELDLNNYKEKEVLDKLDVDFINYENSKK